MRKREKKERKKEERNKKYETAKGKRARLFFGGRGM